MGRKNAAACSRELGAELRKRRQAAGLTGEQLADRTGWHHTTVSRIESGQSTISLVDLMHYLGACKAYLPDARELQKLCEEGQRQLGYFLAPRGESVDSNLSSLVFHESTARQVTTYDPLVVNGLLQTTDYARALISREKWRGTLDVEVCVNARLARQRILNRTRQARFTFFIHEQALRRHVGNDEVTHEQLLHVVLVAALPNVTIRVVPESGMFGGSFHLFSYERHQPLVHVPNQACGLFLEDKKYVTSFSRMVPDIADVALDEEESREFLATLANGYDRERPKRHAAIYELEKEQL